MTHPSDPGHPPRPQAPGQPGPGQPGPGHPGDPYGPPPPPPQQQHPGAVPGPRPPGPGFGPQDRQQEWTPPYPRERAGKGVVGTLFDMNFDHMITAKVVKIVYMLALVPITLVALVLAWYGLAYLEEGSTVGLVLLLTTPFIWLLQVLVTRMVLEFVINQFKISEYLRAIKDKD
ncbi:DUF4282 domain-containing protein [Actinomadura sp. 9N215]|uniref:DUF4282 domain-containing protein n=1 Tax=Actinomadura sp. 9N215 TaxID=3375150 RepID=UPI00379862FD